MTYHKVIRQEGETGTENISDDEDILHLHYHGDEVHVITRSDDDEEGDEFVCELCGEEIVVGTKKYRYHYDDDTGEFVCDECEWSHEDEAQVKRHFTVKHRN